MAMETNIEWADATCNFWHGCTKVSEACRFCYAEALDLRFHPVPDDCGPLSHLPIPPTRAQHWGPNAPRLLRVEAARQEAFRLQRKAKKEGRRLRVFTNSMADFFEDRRDLDEARYIALGTMFETPDLTWMVLTKRPEQIRKLLVHIYSAEGVDRLSPFGIWLGKWLGGTPPANVWLGTTAENQEWADKRVPALLEVPAAVKFLSIEPMLGPIDLDLPRCETHDRDEVSEDGLFCNDCAADGWSGEMSYGHWLDPLNDGIAWVIAGGESGPHARPMHPSWARSLRDQCAEAGVPFFFKQWGEWAPNCLCDTKAAHATTPRPEPGKPGVMFRCGKKAAGRLLDGVEHNNFPEAHHA